MAEVHVSGAEVSALAREQLIPSAGFWVLVGCGAADQVTYDARHGEVASQAQTARLDEGVETSFVLDGQANHHKLVDAISSVLLGAGHEASVSLNKAQRLTLAAAVAPALRMQSDKARQRRVAVTDKDGKVVRYISWADYQALVLKRAGIELDVAEGVRPRSVLCRDCGALVRVEPGKRVPMRCRACRSANCSDCGGDLPAWAVANVRRRGGAPARCSECAGLRRTEMCGRGRHRLAGENRGTTPAGKVFCRECKNERKRQDRRKGSVQTRCCDVCGKALPVSAKPGRPPKSCPGGCVAQETCVGWQAPCSAVPHRHAFHASNVRRRNGEPWRCQACSNKKSGAGRTVAA